MRRWIVVLAAAGILVAVNLVIASRERLLEEGRVVLLDLAPVDPRSLMQGDYMALRFRIIREGLYAASSASDDGRAVLALDDRAVATFRRLDDGSPLAADEVKIRYRVRNGTPRIGTNAYFFQEGHAQDYGKARFGEFRVAPDGEAILTGLRDEHLGLLGKSPRD
jgi:uncharacterized membrane-anchored protein